LSGGVHTLPLLVRTATVLSDPSPHTFIVLD
jgi:hypothetical protein